MNQLNELEISNLNPNKETLWSNFEHCFKDTFTDSNKKQDAYNRLINLYIKDRDINTYIAIFDNLVTKTGWTRGEQTTDIFQCRLDQGTMCAILNQPTWPIILDK
jgi:hypothetical protein